MKKDLFISHASEDKDDFVRPLAGLLKQYGLDVWYDEFELRLGSSLSRSIDKGISNSNYGLLVLSKAFFGKNWTEYELRGLNSYEIGKGDILLPIWKDVDFQEVRHFSPYLADKLALATDKHSIESIALKIIEVVKPDLFSRIHKRLAMKEAMEKAEVKFLQVEDTENIRPGPIIHPKLNENLISRIRLIRASLWLCYPHSMKHWMSGFQRDLNMEDQIRHWEHLSTCFLELITQPDLLQSHLGKMENIYEDLFSLLLVIGFPKNMRGKELLFKSDFEEKVKEIWENSLPVYDIEEDLPY